MTNENLKNVLEVLLWTVGSALVTVGLDMLSAIEMTGNAIYWLPVVNTLLYSAKEYFKVNKPE